MDTGHNFVFISDQNKLFDEFNEVDDPILLVSFDVISRENFPFTITDIMDVAENPTIIIMAFSDKEKKEAKKLDFALVHFKENNIQLTKNTLEKVIKKRDNKKIVNENLRKSELVNALMDSSMDDILIITGINLRIRMVNSGLKEILGITTREVVGKRFVDLHHSLRKIMKQIPLINKEKNKIESEDSTNTIQIEDVNGETRYYEFNIIPLKKGKRKFGYLVIGRDQTSKIMRIESDLRTLRRQESLNTLNIELRKARNLEEGHRTAIECLHTERFTTAVLLISGEEKTIKEESNGNAMTGFHQKDSQGSVEKLVVPEYVYYKDSIFNFKEFLTFKEDNSPLEDYEIELGVSNKPMDRVMKGEELVLIKENMEQLEMHSSCKKIMELLEIENTVAICPIAARIESETGERVVGYYGALVAEPSDDLMDEGDWEYLRGYTNIIGLAIENGKLLENLTRIVSELLEEKKFKDEVIMRMSHNINTPITSLTMNVDYIYNAIEKLIREDSENKSDSNYTEKYKNELTEVLYVSKKISNNISRLNSLSRKLFNSLIVDSEKIGFKVSELDIKDVVEESLHMMKFHLKKFDVKVINNVQNQHLPSVESDTESIIAILEIIIDNAVRYMPKNNQGENSRDPIIELDAYAEGNKIIISIKDNGRGMRKNQLNRIFKRLYRITKVNHHKEGTGLGLPTAKGIANMLGGDIKPYSKFGEGSVFELILPLVPYKM